MNENTSYLLKIFGVECQGIGLTLEPHSPARCLWLDQELPGGAAWWDEVLRKIREADAVVFAQSMSALQSGERRLALASARGRRSLRRPSRL